MCLILNYWMQYLQTWQSIMLCCVFCGETCCMLYWKQLTGTIYLYSLFFLLLNTFYWNSYLHFGQTNKQQIKMCLFKCSWQHTLPVRVGVSNLIILYHCKISCIFFVSNCMSCVKMHIELFGTFYMCDQYYTACVLSTSSCMRLCTMICNTL